MRILVAEDDAILADGQTRTLRQSDGALDGVNDRIRGLDAGADDYMPSPSNSRNRRHACVH